MRLFLYIDALILYIDALIFFFNALICFHCFLNLQVVLPSRNGKILPKTAHEFFVHRLLIRSSKILESCAADVYVDVIGNGKGKQPGKGETHSKLKYVKCLKMYSSPLS